MGNNEKWKKWEKQWLIQKMCFFFGLWSKIVDTNV
jgi:hypothetical protein